MGLRLVLPLPHATYRLGAAAAKSQARLQGGLATLPTHIWLGLLELFAAFRHGGTKSGTKLILWEALRIPAISQNCNFLEPGPEPS